MRLDWPLHGRDAEARRVGQALADPDVAAVVLAGPAGVGKTYFARHCLRMAVRNGYGTASVTGTNAAAGIAFGALAHLLPVSEQRRDGALDNEAALLRRLAAGIAERATPRGLVVFVDDAHLLDDASAALVHHLVVNDLAFVLATLRSGTTAADAITGLWKDGHAERIELRGLDDDVLESLLPKVLGGSIDPSAVAQFGARSQGNMLFLRELVFGALEAGTLREERGIWRLIGPLAPSERLTELVQSRLESLAPAQRSLLEIVAFGEPLGPAEITSLAEDGVVEQLERLHLLRISQDGRRLEFRLAHPLYGDVLRAATPTFRARSIARSLAEAVERTGARRREDPLRIASWRLDAGDGSPALLLTAAKRSRSLYDFALAERLARAAAGAGGFEAALLVAEMASLQGRGDEAEAAFARLADDAETDAERMLAAILRVDNLAIYQGKVDEGLRVAEEAERRILEPAARDEVRAKRSTIVLSIQGPRAAAEVVEPLVTSAQGGALVWACAIGAHAYGRLGQISRALELSAKGHAAHLDLTVHLTWYPWSHLFFRCESLSYAGRFSEAAELAQEQHQRGLVQRSEETQAMFAWQLSKIAAGRGEMTTAVAHGREAVALFCALGNHAFEQAASIPLATALAALGQPSAAAEALSSADLLGLPIFYPVDLLEARAWAVVADGNLPAADRFLCSARDLARSTGDQVGEASVLSAFARMGRAGEVCSRLEELATLVEGDLVAHQASHARLMSRSDAAGLDDLSRSYAAMGSKLLAAESAADAARAWRQNGDEREAVFAEQRSRQLADECGGVSTPALDATTTRARLTPTELQVALLAQGGRSNKAIADELFLSVRTVGNHLHHVYQKLGIKGRDEIQLNAVPQQVAQAARP